MGTHKVKRNYCATAEASLLPSLFACTFSACLFTTPTIASGEEGYLAITAVTVPTQKEQPTWVALLRDDSNTLVHVPPDQALMKLKSGSYKISHIDFGPKICQRGRSPLCSALWIPKDQKRDSQNQIRSIEIKPGMVTVYGTLVLRAKRDKYDVELYQATTALPWLCTHEQESMKNHPVHILQPDKGYKTVKINCINP